MNRFIQMVTDQHFSVNKFIFFFCTFILVSLGGCYQRKEGCLDPVSFNFDPTADDACPDCCTNPLLQLSVKHQVNGKFYSPSDTLINESAQPYKILDFAYYLSDVSAFDALNNPLSGLKKVSYETNAVEAEREDMFVLVRPSVFDFNVNEIRQNGTFVKLSANIGLDEDARNADVWKVENNHILSDSLFLRNNNGEKIWGYVTIAKGTGFTDTTTISFTLQDAENAMTFQSEKKVAIGQNLTYNLVVEYTEWFRFVDLNLPDKLIKSMLQANLKSAFRVE